MTENMLTYKGLVYPWHCDHMGHMNVMWYVGKFDEATWAFFSNIGLTPDYLRDSGTGMAAVDQQLNYEREALPGDLLEIFSRPLEVTNKSIRFSHEMINAQTGKISAKCQLIAVHLDTKARKSVALPDSIRERAMKMMKDSSSPG